MRNLEKIKPFLELYNNGKVIYKNGALYRTEKRKNQYTTIKLEEPEKMASKSQRYWRVSHNRVHCYEHIVIYAIFNGFESLKEIECIDHKDGNRWNNDINNLDGVTVDENNNRAKENGLLNPRIGIDNGMSKLSEEDVLKIKEIYSNGKHTQKDIGEMYNVSQTAISDIINKKRWKHL